MSEFQHFLNRLWSDVSPVLTIIWSGIFWVVFPDAAYIPAAIAVGLAIALDLFTKLYSLARNNGGYIEATKSKIIASNTLWRKTSVKIFAYLVVMILAGLSLRVSPLEQAGIFFATVIYAIIFIRESQSILENLIEAGADGLKPLLFWLKKKELSITETENNENTEG